MADDQATVKVGIDTTDAVAALQEVITYLQSMDSHLAKMATSHATASNAAATHTSTLKAFENGLRSALEQGKNLADNILKVAESISAKLGPALGLAVPLLGALEFKSVIDSTMQWDQSLADLSRVLNNNVEAASKWRFMAEAMGVDSDQLVRAIRMLSEHIDLNSTALRELGVPLTDTNGNFRSMDAILTDTITKLSAMQDHTTAAGLATQLFGRNVQEIFPFLTATPGQLKAAADEAQKLGAIMGTEDVSQMRAFEFELAEARSALEILQVSIGHALLPALADLGQAFTQLVESHLGQIKAFFVDISSAIIGFAEGLSGQSFALDDFAKQLGTITAGGTDFGNSMDTATQQADALAQKEQDITNATRAQTQAIREQEQAIQNEQHAYDQNVQDQIAGLQRITELQQFQLSMEEAQFSLEEDQAKLRQDTQKLHDVLDYGDYNTGLNLQNEILGLNHKITVEQQKMVNDTAAQQRRQLEEQLRMQQQAYDDEARAKVQALEHMATAAEDEARLEIEALQNQKKAYDSASNSILQDAIIKGTQSGKGFGDALNTQVQAAAKKFGENMKTGIMDFFHWLSEPDAQRDTDLANFMVEVGTIIETWPGWPIIGKAVGAAIVAGVENEILSQLPGFLRGMLAGSFSAGAHIGIGVGHAAAPTATHMAAGAATGSIEQQIAQWISDQQTINDYVAGVFAEGGIIPGADGAPKLAVVHGGEVVLNKSQQAALLAGQVPGVAAQQAMQMTNHFYISGATDARAVARQISSTLAQMWQV